MERLGIIGAPSDWLIASAVDYDVIKEKMHIELVDIPIEFPHRFHRCLSHSHNPELASGNIKSN